MPVASDAASAVAAALGAALGRGGATAFLGSWLDTRNRRLTARVHQRAISDACALARAVPASVSLDHEDRPEYLRLHLRVEHPAPPSLAGSNPVAHDSAQPQPIEEQLWT